MITSEVELSGVITFSDTIDSSAFTSLAQAQGQYISFHSDEEVLEASDHSSTVLSETSSEWSLVCDLHPNASPN